MSFSGTDEIESVHIYARYEDGKFIDLDTGQPVLLKGSPQVKIVVDRSSLPSRESLALHTSYISKKVLGRGTELEFELSGMGLLFTVILTEDLIFTRRGNKRPVADPCRIGIVAMRDSNPRSGDITRFEKWEVNSLNQAYFQVSVKYKPQGKSHSINVYEHFHLKGDYTRTLDTLRKF